MESLMRSFRTSIIILFVTVILFGCGSNPTDIVKDGHLKFDKSVTIGEALERNKLLQNQTWEEFEDEAGRTIVEFTAVADIPCMNDDVCATITEYSIKTKWKLQFTVNGDKFELSFIGAGIDGLQTLKEMFKYDGREKVFETFQPYTFDSIKVFYKRDPLPVNTSLVYAVCERPAEYKQMQENKARVEKVKPYINMVFDSYSDRLEWYARRIIPFTFVIHSRDENSHIVMASGGYSDYKGHIHIVSADTRSVCEVESTFKTDRRGGARTSFSVADCPNMKMNRHNASRIINIMEVDCGTCGLNGTLEGDYTFVAEIDFSKDNDGYIYPTKATFEGKSFNVPSKEKYWWKQ